jgi:hypothetical protein
MSNEHKCQPSCVHSKLVVVCGVVVTFLGTFANCDKRVLASSCLSVRPDGVTRFPLDGFPRNVISVFFDNTYSSSSSSSFLLGSR